MKIKSAQKNISDGWQVVPAGEIFSFVRTHAFSRDNLTNGLAGDGNVGNIHYGDIHATYKTPSINLDNIPIPLVNDTGFSPLKGDLLIDGDLIMADASEDYEGIGVTVSVHGLKNKKVVGGLHTFVLRDRKGQTNKYYRQYIFLNPAVRNKLQKVANGVSVYGISKTEVSKILLPIPPLPEQNRIVSVLEIWDKVIEKLAKKIELKKNIKKGLMQRLLTGELRLPGFSETWQVIKLGKIGETYSGITGKDKDDFGFGEPFISYMNIYSNWRINTNINDLVNIKEAENQNKAEYGDIFFTTSSETPDEVGISSVLLDKNIGSLYLNSFCFGFRLNDFKILIPEFAQHYFRGQKFRKQMTRLAQGASRFNLSKKYFLDTTVEIPKNINEQIAIANVFTSANKEIVIFEQKLKRLKEQKKYLLNNLITGAIRTPETMKINA